MSNYQAWYFTFAVGHAYNGSYVRIYGTRDEARKEMMQAFPEAGGFQYADWEKVRGLNEINHTTFHKRK